MLFARIQISLVERTFENISFFRFPSNLTFAAIWKIIETCSINVCLSFFDKPKSSLLISPRTGINFSKLEWFSFLSLSNS